MNFVCDKVFRALQKHGPINGADLAKIMRRRSTSVQQCMSRLKARGMAENLGGGRGSIWIAIGNSPPFDGRGTHRNSVATLFKHQREIVRRRDIPRPWKATALEQCIGWGVEKR